MNDMTISTRQVNTIVTAAVVLGVVSPNNAQALGNTMHNAAVAREMDGNASRAGRAVAYHFSPIPNDDWFSVNAALQSYLHAVVTRNEGLAMVAERLQRALAAKLNCDVEDLARRVDSNEAQLVAERVGNLIRVGKWPMYDAREELALRAPELRIANG